MSRTDQSQAYLDRALQIEQFLSSTAVETEHGLTWRRTPDSSPVRSLYHGAAGVLLFYIELYLATNDETMLQVARDAGDELCAFVTSAEAGTADTSVAIYSGWPGYAFALNELQKASGDVRFQEAAKVALTRLTDQSVEIGAGIGWVEPLPFSEITGITGEREMVDLSVGSTGAGLIYLYAFREGLLPDLSLAIQTADRLLEVADQTADGLRWFMTVDMPFPFTAPNFAHGGAGVGYFLADLFSETGTQQYADAALSAGEYVKSRAVPHGDGHLVCRVEEEQPPTTFYLGVCHGPAGTGRFMYLLHQLAPDAGYLEWLRGNFEGLVSTGAPEQRTPGLWNNYGQCCGDAGIGDYALSLYATTQDTTYLDFALRCAETISAAADTMTGWSWHSAEHRDRPEHTESQTGYMQGAAGIGSFFVHLATALAGNPVKVALPETPFTVPPA